MEGDGNGNGNGNGENPKDGALAVVDKQGGAEQGEGASDSSETSISTPEIQALIQMIHDALQSIMLHCSIEDLAPESLVMRTIQELREKVAKTAPAILPIFDQITNNLVVKAEVETMIKGKLDDALKLYTLTKKYSASLLIELHGDITTVPDDKKELILAAIAISPDTLAKVEFMFRGEFEMDDKLKFLHHFLLASDDEALKLALPEMLNSDCSTEDRDKIVDLLVRYEKFRLIADILLNSNQNSGLGQDFLKTLAEILDNSPRPDLAQDVFAGEHAHQIVKDILCVNAAMKSLNTAILSLLGNPKPKPGDLIIHTESQADYNSDATDDDAGKLKTVVDKLITGVSADKKDNVLRHVRAIIKEKNSAILSDFDRATDYLVISEDFFEIMSEEEIEDAIKASIVSSRFSIQELVTIMSIESLKEYSSTVLDAIAMSSDQDGKIAFLGTMEDKYLPRFFGFLVSGDDHKVAQEAFTRILLSKVISDANKNQCLTVLINSRDFDVIGNVLIKDNFHANPWSAPLADALSKSGELKLIMEAYNALPDGSKAKKSLFVANIVALTQFLPSVATPAPAQTVPKSQAKPAAKLAAPAQSAPVGASKPAAPAAKPQAKPASAQPAGKDGAGNGSATPGGGK